MFYGRNSNETLTSTPVIGDKTPPRKRIDLAKAISASNKTLDLSDSDLELSDEGDMKLVTESILLGVLVICIHLELCLLPLEIHL